jgi:DNA-binding transcriptional regulator YhcF (GntR family)
LSPGKTVENLVDRLRDRIVAGLHVGSLRGGDRLASIREVAAETGEDERKVAKAYRTLQEEGLVEVRGRSGVFVAPQIRFVGGMLQETVEWIAEVLWEGWKRRIALPTFPDLVKACSAKVDIRCAFVESCEDVFETFMPELQTDFGLQVSAVRLDSLPVSDSGVSPSALPIEVREAELIVTTIIHAATVRTRIKNLEKPILILSIHPNVVEQISKYLREEESVTIVCVDPEFGDRIRLQYRDHIRNDGQLRVVLWSDEEQLKTVDRSRPVLVTRAAHKRLGGGLVKRVGPYYPSVSPDSAHEIIRCLIGLNATSSTLP